MRRFKLNMPRIARRWPGTRPTPLLWLPQPCKRNRLSGLLRRLETLRFWRNTRIRAGALAMLSAIGISLAGCSGQPVRPSPPAPAVIPCQKPLIDPELMQPTPRAGINELLLFLALPPLPSMTAGKP